MLGQRFGRLLVVRRGRGADGKTAWLCRCDCGADTFALGSLLRQGRRVSCGCVKSPDLTGQRFSRLLVLRLAEHKRRRAWLCRCDCGSETVVTTDSLCGGGTRSCGCLHTEINRALAKKYFNTGQGNPTHGLSYTHEYYVWGMMKKRCLNSTVARYKDYGGRGIRICERWLKFENFLADMGPRPAGVSAGGRALYSVERLDNDGDYEPGNCRWATMKEQMANRRPRS